jgi:hypothetical protein
MIARFDGSCEPFAILNVGGLVSWIAGIPFEDWPQQHRLADGQVRPAMVTDLTWRGFGSIVAPYVADLMASFPGCEAHQLMLSAVMPGHSIEPHRDQQAPAWRCRAHVPLRTNDKSKFIVDGVAHALKVGAAYRVNTLAEHAVTNKGDAPRVHLMFDVRLT